MDTTGLAEYFCDQGMKGYIDHLAKELSKEIEARMADLQIVDALADSVEDAELLARSARDNDVIIGMIYAAQNAIAGTIDMLQRRQVFAAQ